MWHASISGPTLNASKRQGLAELALRGVGDDAHQWAELRPVAFHLRRRLTPEEVERVGTVRDLRGTPEGRQRLLAALRWLPATMVGWAQAEVEEKGTDGTE